MKIRSLVGVIGFVVIGLGGAAMSYAAGTETQKKNESSGRPQEVRRGGGGWWTLVDGSKYIPGGAPRDPRETEACCR